MSLERAIAMAESIQNGASGMPVDRLTLSQLIDKSPSSSGFHNLVLASRAYGLTNGGKNAEEFSLTQLGQQAVSDDRQDRIAARRRAVLSVEPFRAFLTAHDKKKVPLPAPFQAFLTSKAGVPGDRADECMEQILENARFTQMIRSVKGADYIDIGAALQLTQAAVEDVESTELDAAEDEMTIVEDELPGDASLPPPQQTPRVFITHGKNQEIVNQLRELLKFGQFEPVVAQEHETVSKPVPDKVLGDMRSCSAAVIHVATEQKLLDEGGKEHHRINENVLIEIGAAMALYGNNFILLTPKGLHLPSNLQGLYRCEYDGDTLDYDATMKLLKAFNDFR